MDRPVFAGALGCLMLLPIGMLRHRDPGRFIGALAAGLNRGMLQLVGVGIACAVAGLVVGTLSMADLTGKISSGMFALAAGNFALTLAVASGVIILLGMGMPTPAVYALAAVLAAPALLALNIDLLPAHLFIVYFASMSAITPPVAVAAFAAASIARADPMPVALLACRIGLVAFLLPLVYITQPGLLLIGDAVEVGVTLLCVTLGVLTLAVVLEGYLFSALSMPARAALLVLALGLLFDTGSWRWGYAVALGALMAVACRRRSIARGRAGHATSVAARRKS